MIARAIPTRDQATSIASIAPTTEPNVQRLLGVFAHPDDETFCAGGTFARYAEGGADVMVLSATRGDAGQIRDARAATRRTLPGVRQRELQSACQTLGIERVACLDYPDGSLADLDPERLTRDVTAAIRRFRPDVVITFGEDGAYGHPDHVAIGAATVEACDAAADPERFPDQLSAGVCPHRVDAIYFSHFPRQPRLMLERLVHWLLEHERRFQGNDAFVRSLHLLAEQTVTLGFARDHVSVQWYPAGFSILEQGECASALYLILSGQVDVVRDEADGSTTDLARLSMGSFFGEEGLARSLPRNAHIVAASDTTCLVFAPSPPSLHAGRGGKSGSGSERRERPEKLDPALVRIDVRSFVEQKIRAISAHRTQYPIDPDLLPQGLLAEMLDTEFFVRADGPRRSPTAL